MKQTNRQLFENYLNLVVETKKKINILKCENEGLKRRVKALEQKTKVLKENIILHKKEKKVLFNKLQEKLCQEKN